MAKLQLAPKYNYTMKANDYKTPEELYSKALEFFNIEQFDCDVCCLDKNIPANVYFVDGITDGLKACKRKTPV